MEVGNTLIFHGLDQIVFLYIETQAMDHLDYPISSHKFVIFVLSLVRENLFIQIHLN